MLALLAIEGERSGYDLLKFVRKAIGYVWAPAKTQLYTVLPRLVRDGLAHSRRIGQTTRPDKQLYRIARAGRRALDAWLEEVVPGDADTFHLKLFVGALTTHDVLIAHVEQHRRDIAARLAELRRIEPTNTGRGHDRYHRYLLELGIGRAEHDLRWADRVLRSLRAG